METILELGIEECELYIRCITNQIKSERGSEVEMHNALVKGKGLKLIDPAAEAELYSQEPKKEIVDASRAMIERHKARRVSGNS